MRKIQPIIIISGKEEFNFYHNSQSDNNYRMSQSIDDIKTKIAKEMGELELNVLDDFNLFHDRTDKRFNSLETNLHTSLFNSAKSQNELFANINAHMARIRRKKVLLNYLKILSHLKLSCKIKRQEVSLGR